MSANRTQKNTVPGIKFEDRNLRLRELIQCCVQFSLPLPVQDPTATAKALSATSMFVKDMIILDKHNALELSIALVWRVVETEDELDRLGAWFIIDQVVRDAIAEEKLPLDQRCLSPCISNLVHAMPMLIKCRWSEFQATNPTYAKPYSNMRKNWTRAISSEAKAQFEEAFKEVRDKGLNNNFRVGGVDENSPYKIEAKYRDALWKLKLKSPRPSLAHAMKTLFVLQNTTNSNNNQSSPTQHPNGIVPAGHYSASSAQQQQQNAASAITDGETTLTLKHSGALAALKAHANISGLNFLQADAAPPANNNNKSSLDENSIAERRASLLQTGPRVHDRIRKWIGAIDNPAASYCLGCDVWDHTEKNCPCTAPPQSRGLTRKQAVNLLLDAGVSQNYVSIIGAADDLPAVSETVDVIFQHITRKSPEWTLLIDAFDVLRQRFSDVAQRRALLLLASYNLPPSKALIQNLGSNNANQQASYGREFFRARDVLFKSRRLVELQRLSRAVLTLTCAYLNPDVNSDSRYLEALSQIKSKRSFLFCLHGVSSVPFAYDGADGRPLIEGTGFSDRDTCVFAPPSAGPRPFQTIIENPDAVRPLTECPEQVDLLKSAVHHLSRIDLESLPFRKKGDGLYDDDNSINALTNAENEAADKPQREPWDFWVARNILMENHIYPNSINWPRDEPKIKETIDNIRDPAKRLRLETAVWLLIKRKVPYCNECGIYGHHSRRCVLSHRSILGKARISEFELRLWHQRYTKHARDCIDGRLNISGHPIHDPQSRDKELARRDGFALRDACNYYADAAYPQEFADAVDELKSFNGETKINLSLCQYFPQIACKIAAEENLEVLIPKIMVVASPEFPSVCAFCSSFHHDSSKCPTFSADGGADYYDEQQNSRAVGLLDDGSAAASRRQRRAQIVTPYDKLFKLLRERGVTLRDYCHARTLMNEAGGSSIGNTQGGNNNKNKSGLVSLHQASVNQQTMNNPRLAAAKEAAMEIDRLSSMYQDTNNYTNTSNNNQQFQQVPGFDDNNNNSQQPGYEYNSYDDFYQTNNPVAQSRMERFGTTAPVAPQQQQQQYPSSYGSQQQLQPQDTLGAATSLFGDFMNQQMNLVMSGNKNMMSPSSSQQQQQSNQFDNMFYGGQASQSQQSGYDHQYSNYNNTSTSQQQNYPYNNSQQQQPSSKASSSGFLSGFTLSKVVKNTKKQVPASSTSNNALDQQNQQQQQHAASSSFDNLSLEEQQRLALEASDNVMMMNQQHQDQQHQQQVTSYDALLGFDSNNHENQDHHQHQQIAGESEQDVFDDILNAGKAKNAELESYQQQQYQQEGQVDNTDQQQEQQNQPKSKGSSKGSSPSRRNRDGDVIVNEETGEIAQSADVATEDELAALV